MMIKSQNECEKCICKRYSYSVDYKGERYTPKYIPPNFYSKYCINHINPPLWKGLKTYKYIIKDKCIDIKLNGYGDIVSERDESSGLGRDNYYDYSTNKIISNPIGAFVKYEPDLKRHFGIIPKTFRVYHFESDEQNLRKISIEKLENSNVIKSIDGGPNIFISRDSSNL